MRNEVVLFPGMSGPHVFEKLFPRFVCRKKLSPNSMTFLIFFSPEFFESCHPVFSFSSLFVSLSKMWFLIDESGEKVSEFFPSQAKLAVFMQILPQTLNKAIQKGKNVFQFRGQEVKVVQQTIPHFAVFDFSPSENPIETFELIPEVARWLQVSNQTVHAAIKRGDETKIKNKEGTVFWLKKLKADESREKNTPVKCSPTPISQPPPVPLPRKKVGSSSIPPVPPVPLPRRKVGSLPIPPIPFPRRKVPDPPQSPPIPFPRRKVPDPPQSPLVPLPRRKVNPPPQFSPEPVVAPAIPPEVAEIIEAGETCPFATSKTIEPTNFLSAEKVARFIKSGIGKIFLHGPKKNQMFICNDKKVFLPDLVKEIIVFHIRDQMWKDGDRKATEAFIEKAMEYNFSQKKNKDWIDAGFLAKVRRLDDEAVMPICKELVKMICW